MTDVNGADINGAMGACSKSCMGWVLLISLALNLFFGGLLVGKHIYAGNGGGKIAQVISAFSDLNPDSRTKAMAAAEKDWPAIQKQLKDVKAKRDAVKKILAQDAYKQEDLDKAFAEVRTSVDALLEKGQVLGSDIAGSLTTEERQKLIQNLPNGP